MKPTYCEWCSAHDLAIKFRMSHTRKHIARGASWRHGGGEVRSSSQHGLAGATGAARRRGIARHARTPASSVYLSIGLPGKQATQPRANPEHRIIDRSTSSRELASGMERRCVLPAEARADRRVPRQKMERLVTSSGLSIDRTWCEPPGFVAMFPG